ncbi:MAG TPA: universal stress protein [Cyclobacteriaceae bacterium]|nr:universal stress protein [Cyclobacteriaceae bacterium]
MKKILVPTDFSDLAGYAFDFAHQIAKSLSADIELFHVLDIPDSMGYNDLNVTGSQLRHENIDDIYVIKLLEVTKKKMMKIINNPKYEGVRIKPRIKAGSAYKKIYDEIISEKIDLIVMGTAGTDSWEQSVMGTTAERVVRFANCPVISMRKPARLDKIKNLAYASDFENDHAIVTELISDLSALMNSKIHLVKINTPSHFQNDKENYAVIKSFADDQKLKNYEMHVHNHQFEEDGIVQFSEMYKMDMVVMTTRGKTGFARLLEGSIAEEVVNYSKIPVLTCRISK